MLKYQISWKSLQWEPSCTMQTDGQTERHDEADSRFSQFCERAWKSDTVWQKTKTWILNGRPVLQGDCCKNTVRLEGNRQITTDRQQLQPSPRPQNNVTNGCIGTDLPSKHPALPTCWQIHRPTQAPLCSYLVYILTLLYPDMQPPPRNLIQRTQSIQYDVFNAFNPRD